MAKIVKDKDTANLERVEPVAEDLGPAEQASQVVTMDNVAVEPTVRVAPPPQVAPVFITSNDVALAIGYTGANEHSAQSRVEQAAVQMADALCSMYPDPETRSHILAAIVTLVAGIKKLSV